MKPAEGRRPLKPDTRVTSRLRTGKARHNTSRCPKRDNSNTIRICATSTGNATIAKCTCAGDAACVRRALEHHDRNATSREPLMGARWRRGRMGVHGCRLELDGPADIEPGSDRRARHHDGRRDDHGPHIRDSWDHRCLGVGTFEEALHARHHPIMRMVVQAPTWIRSLVFNGTGW